MDNTKMFVMKMRIAGDVYYVVHECPAINDSVLGPIFALKGKSCRLNISLRVKILRASENVST